MTRDLQLDCDNNIYVTDSDNHRVVMFYPNNPIGVIIAGINGPGAGADEFSIPYGTFLDENRTLYVADQGNHRVQMWPAGAISGVTVAGISGLSGSSLMRLNRPSAVVVDNNGYVMNIIWLKSTISLLVQYESKL